MKNWTHSSMIAVFFLVSKSGKQFEEEKRENLDSFFHSRRSKQRRKNGRIQSIDESTSIYIILDSGSLTYFSCGITQNYSLVKEECKNKKLYKKRCILWYKVYTIFIQFLTCYILKPRSIHFPRDYQVGECETKLLFLCSITEN